MNLCPQCQTSNKPGARFCRRCGAALSPKSVKTIALPSPDATTTPQPAEASAVAVTQRLSQPQSTRLAEGELLFDDRYEVATCIEQTPARNSYLAQNRAARPCQKCQHENVHDAAYCDNCGAKLPDRGFLLLVESFDENFAAGGRALLKLNHPSLVKILAYTRNRSAAAPPRVYILKEPILADSQHPAIRSGRRLADLPPITSEQALELLRQIAPLLDLLVDAGLYLPDLAASQLLLLDDGNGAAAGSRLRLDVLEIAQIFAAGQNAQVIAHHLRLLAKLLRELTRGQELPPSLLAFLGDPAKIEQPASATALVDALTESLRGPRPSTGLAVVVGKLTDLGRMRKINEDSILTLELDQFHNSANSPLRLYALADGMGGHAAGEVASKLALNQLSKSLMEMTQAAVAADARPARFDYTAVLKKAGQSAAKTVYDQAQRTRSDMGTTLVATLVDTAARTAYIINVGDSRLYKIDSQGIRQVTKDHSMVQMLLDKQQITPEEARNHPNANLIYRTLGEKPNVEIDGYQERLAVGDTLLLCSDGLSGLVENEQLRAAVLANPTPQAACARLVEMANRAGGHDNISVIIIRLQEEGV